MIKEKNTWMTFSTKVGDGESPETLAYGRNGQADNRTSIRMTAVAQKQ